MNAFLNEILPIMPEVFMALAGLWLLLMGLFLGSGQTRYVNLLAVVILVAAAAMVVFGVADKRSVWGGLLLVNEYTQTAKLLVLAAAALVLILTSDWFKDPAHQQFEYPLLAIFSIIGMMLLISANDLLSFYLAIELMSLPLYLLATIERDSLRSTEAGIKYFVLGSLASGLMLFGMSLVYGFLGATGFDILAKLLASIVASDAGIHAVAPGVMIGVILILVGVFFKISAAPFHMWAPDVYEGVPTPVTAFFAGVPKLATLAFLARFLAVPLGDIAGIWQQVVTAVAVLTMLVGALGALWQTNIKRLLAYSSIGHAGYVLVGVAAGNVGGLKGVLIYLALYLFMSIGSFGLVMLMKRDGKAVEEISELGGLSRTHPLMAFSFAVFLFSMAGIPPLAGFFAKLYIFLAAVQAGLIPLAVIGVLTSVIACYYYIKIVKIMYFEEARPAFAMDHGPAMKWVLGLCVAVIFFYILIPGPLIGMATRAAESAFL